MSTLTTNFSPPNMNASALGEEIEIPAEFVAFSSRLIGSYIAVATLGMFLWDVLINPGSEYRLVLKRGLGLLTVAYVWARVVALTILIGAVIFLTVPLDRYCFVFSRIVLSLLPTFVTAESLLLFFRVRAIYLEQRRVVVTFLVLLLIVAASSALIPFSFTGFPAGPTNPYCTASVNMQLSEALIVIPLINEVFTFIAISYKLVPPRFEEEEPAQKCLILDLRKWAFWRGKDLPMLSRTLWQDGQIYILIFILTTVVALVPMSVANIPVIYRFIFIYPIQYDFADSGWGRPDITYLL
uniref:Uncharacterized protein n=1 Tax=Moniliophthora roreri TaxID=221103 RepID=A0A0W0FPT4_MONRR